MASKLNRKVKIRYRSNGHAELKDWFAIGIHLAFKTGRPIEDFIATNDGRILQHHTEVGSWEFID